MSSPEVKSPDDDHTPPSGASVSGGKSRSNRMVSFGDITDSGGGGGGSGTTVIRVNDFIGDDETDGILTPSSVFSVKPPPSPNNRRSSAPDVPKLSSIFGSPDLASVAGSLASPASVTLGEIPMLDGPRGFASEPPRPMQDDPLAKTTSGARMRFRDKSPTRKSFSGTNSIPKNDSKNNLSKLFNEFGPGLKFLKRQDSGPAPAADKTHGLPVFDPHGNHMVDWEEDKEVTQQVEMYAIERTKVTEDTLAPGSTATLELAKELQKQLSMERTKSLPPRKKITCADRHWYRKLELFLAFI
jgi:hypothetical protein